jgi:hypothetical protein
MLTVAGFQHTRRRWLAAAFALVVGSLAPVAHGAEPAPPYPPPREVRPPHPPPYAPPPTVVAPPPPLSPLMRTLYAPFYAAGLVVRYGVYYLLVAPIEVFSRTLEYGVEGGVRDEPPPPPPTEDAR